MPKTRKIDLDKFDDCINEALAFLNNIKKDRQKRRQIAIRNKQRAIEALKADKKLSKQKPQDKGFKMKKFGTVGELIDTMNTALNRIAAPIADQSSTVSETA